MFSLIFSFFFFFQRVSAGFDRFSVRVNAVSHGNSAISVIFSDEFVYSPRYSLFNCVYWIKNVVVRAQSRPDTVSPRVSLPVFPRWKTRSRERMADRIAERRMRGNYISLDTAYLVRATREACRVCMRGTLIYVSFYVCRATKHTWLRLYVHNT